MQWKRQSWLIACLSLILTVSLLAGGHVLWDKFAMAKSLDKLAQGIDGVRQITWEDNGKKDGAVKINAYLENVVNLEATYRALLENSRQVLSNRKFQIVIRDDRTPELEEFYYIVHYQVQEAIATGRFSAMADRIQEESRKKNVETRVFVDGSYVYLQMKKDQAAMYVVIARQPALREVK